MSLFKVIGVEINVQYFHDFPFFIQSSQSIIKSLLRQCIKKNPIFWAEFLARLYKMGFKILFIPLRGELSMRNESLIVRSCIYTTRKIKEQYFKNY